MAELVPRRTFVLGPKRPVITFFTSSRAKFSQALALFDIAGLRLSHRAQEARPYDESYSGTKEELLGGAIREIQRRGGASASFFFVEDTSIRIDALSAADADYPGLEAKEWFANTTFDALDHVLQASGNRRCVVKSGIGLSVPGLAEPIFFHGETSGTVVESLPTAKENVFYPWLSPNSFNAWFIPDGADKTLSEMSFEESLRFDFRVFSITQLLDRLEEYSLILNLSPGSFVRRQQNSRDQAALFSVAEPVLLIVGPTCAGKTTFGINVQQTLDWTFVDASSIVKVMRDERGATERIGKFASSLLEAEGSDIVARYIAENLVRDGSEPTVITGFRTIEEVEFFRETYQDVRVVSVSAPQRLRYERYVRRNTRDVRSFAQFQQTDEEQHLLGLLRVADELADVRVENVYSEEEYASQIAKVLGVRGAAARGVTHVERRLEREKSQLYRCLLVLRRVGRPLTTQELSALSGESTILHNNVNKMLKRYPELARRQESPGANVRYSITERGLAFISAIDRLASRRPVDRSGGRAI